MGHAQIMSKDGFVEKYGYTDRRRYLIESLEIEIGEIARRGWTCRAYIFGSMVNSENPAPSDIDVLLCVSTLSLDKVWKPSRETKEAHIFPVTVYALSTHTGPVLKSCLCPSEMVLRFNEGMRKTDENISICESELIEVTWPISE